LPVPAVGMLSGYWLRSGKLGWLRSLIVACSLLVFVGAIIIVTIAMPQVEHLSNESKKQAVQVQKQQLDKAIERLFLGIYAADLAIVIEQLDSGVAVNARDETQQTPLHVAQDRAIVKLLVARGADVEALNDTGESPIFNKEIENAQIILSAGADINATNRGGNTLLIRYAYAGYLPGMKVLVALGADVNHCNRDGHNVMDIAEHFHPNAELLGYLQTLKIESCPN